MKEFRFELNNTIGERSEPDFFFSRIWRHYIIINISIPIIIITTKHNHLQLIVCHTYILKLLHYLLIIMEVRGEQSRQGAKVSCQDRLCIEEEEEEDGVIVLENSLLSTFWVQTE